MTKIDNERYICKIFDDGSVPNNTENLIYFKWIHGPLKKSSRPPIRTPVEIAVELTVDYFRGFSSETLRKILEEIFVEGRVYGDI